LLRIEEFYRAATKEMRSVKKLKVSIVALLCIGVTCIAVPSLADSTQSSEVTKRRYVKKKKKKPRKKPVDLIKTSLVNQVLMKGAGGLAIGFTNANLECDCSGPSGEYDNQTGLFAAGRYEKAMGPLLSYAGELAYAEKGSTLEAGDDDIEYTLPYIQVAGQLKLRFTATRLASIYVGAGPYVALMTGASVQQGDTKDRAAAKQFSSVDAGLSLTGGTYVAISKRMQMLATLGFAYYRGFTNIYDDLPDDDRLTTSAFMMTAGILFAGG